MRPCFRLAGMADFTQDFKDNESEAYGSVLALFRPEYSTGAVVVQCRPSGMSATWTITGPNGYFAQGEGDAVIPDLEPGSYTIGWDEREGWAGPGGSTGNLEADRALAQSSVSLMLGDFRSSAPRRRWTNSTAWRANLGFRSGTFRRTTASSASRSAASACPTVTR